MNERSIFLQAMEKSDATERSEYLATACGDDAALRRRVELLLQSHTEAGSFLGVPVLEQQPEPSGTPEDATETHHGPHADENSGTSLDFLAAAQRPGSLGRVGHYEVLEVVGRGGMGIVLRAFDEKLHRVVAVKVMARELASNAVSRKRFLREAAAAAAVANDNVVAIHAIHDEGMLPYLVMQFIEGVSLQQKIATEGSLELKEILRIGSQIAAGLASAHKQGLAHRDIKPANILLENGVERVKITDFGLARAVDDASVTHSGVIAGTPQYMSPEQADGKTVDHRSDLFSLGSVMYAMCTGRAPFRAESTLATLKRVCEDTPRPIREVNPDIPEWLCEIIAKLHAKNPAERHQTAKEVAGLLEERLAHVQKGFTSLPPFSPMMALLEEHLAQEQKGTVASPAASASASATPPAPALRDIPAALALKVALGLLTVGGIVQVVLLAGWITRGAIYGWAAGASAVAMGFLALFFLYHLVIYLRAKHRARIVAGVLGTRRWPRLIGYGVLILLGLVAIAMWGNALDKGKRFFYHELVVQLPDTDTVVQFWETKDEVERENAWNFSGAWPMEPRATIANTKEKRLRLPPANYWMFVTKDGKSVERRLLKIGWGGTQTLAIAGTAAGGLAMRDQGPGEGWVQLFNGKDLSGWKTHPPLSRAWRVEDGMLVGSNKEANPPHYSHLATARSDWRNFHLRAEARINSAGDSGILFRCRPDTLSKQYPHGYEGLVNVGNQKAPRTGSLQTPKAIHEYGNDPLVPANTWFTYEIIAQEDRFILKVNGQTTLDWKDGNADLFAGAIALQMPDDRTHVEFRKIEIKELGPAELNWVQLFNGEDLSGWKPFPAERQSWKVVDGILAGHGKPAHLFSERGDYQNFHLRVETRVSKAGACGLFFRVPFEDPAILLSPHSDSSLTSARMAKLYGDDMPPDPNPPRHRTMSLGVWGACKRGHTWVRRVPENEWFVQEVIAEGKQIQIKYPNGYSGYVERPDRALCGHLALQLFDADSKIEYRKIEIKELGRSVPGAAEIAAELEKLRGEWNGVAGELEAKPVPSDRLSMFFRKATVVGDQWRVTMEGQPLTATIMLDPIKQPKEIDFVITSGLEPLHPVRRLRGIYELEGSTAKICFNQLGGDRPTLFTTKSGDSSTYMIVLERKSAEPGFVPLCTGKDLTGWKTHPRLPGEWKVENGVLTNTGPRSFLFTERDDYEDFHLRVEAKINAAGDSGVFFRSRFDPLVDFPAVSIVQPASYEVQIRGDEKGGRTGAIFLTTDGTAHPALTELPENLTRPDVWFTLEVIAQGPWLTVIIDGKQLPRLKNETYRRGHIALQHFGPKTSAQFRKIEIKELPAPGVPAKPAPIETSELDQLVKLAQEQRDLAVKRLETGKITGQEMNQAEIALLEVRLRRAVIRSDFAEQELLLSQSITVWEEQLHLFKLQSQAGKASAKEVTDVAKGLLEAQLRLKEIRRDRPAPPPPSVLKMFDPAKEKPIAAGYVDEGKDGLRFTTDKAARIRLYELANPDVDNCRLIFRAKLRTAEVERACLQLSARVPGEEMALDTLDETLDYLEGDREWTTCEVKLYLRPGQRPTVVELGIHLGSRPRMVMGKKALNQVWIKDIELLKTPLPKAEAEGKKP